MDLARSGKKLIDLNMETGIVFGRGVWQGLGFFSKYDSIPKGILGKTIYAAYANSAGMEG